MCGELPPGAMTPRTGTGSSPRVRGTPSMATAEQRVVTVHPRVCGELQRRAFLFAHCAGSSPRVRGTRDRGHDLRAPRRFIPACAGNSSGASAAAPRSAVHPRVCGELGHGVPAVNASPGSSPRVRGTRDARRRRPRADRFIPACAGNSSVGRNSRQQGSGSSPRVRGTRPDVFAEVTA